MSDSEKMIKRIIALVNEMRENSQDMRMWKNIPMAKECIDLLKAINDPEETAMGKALACEAIIAQLPEYDMPRFVLSILNYKLELIEQSDEHDPDRYPTAEEVQADIRRLEDYIDTEHIGTE